MTLREYLARLCAAEDLSESEAREALTYIMEGSSTPAQTAAFMVALKMKGETPEEVLGCARAMREKAFKVSAKAQNLVDTCGTGGDGGSTFNVSTTAALIAAGAGLNVAKHGNRSVSSKCGSADVLEELGVNIMLTAEEQGLCLDEVGISFLFAPLLHPAMKNAAVPRREVGVRSVFNLLGPLTNPAGVKRQLVGVYAPELTGLLGKVFSMLGCERALVVHGCDGSDEITLTGETMVCEVDKGQVRNYLLVPEDAGLTRVPPGSFRGGEPSCNAATLLSVLEGDRGPCRDLALINAGAVLFIGGAASSLKEGVACASAAIDSGAAMGKLAALRRFTARFKQS